MYPVRASLSTDSRSKLEGGVAPGVRVPVRESQVRAGVASAASLRESTPDLLPVTSLCGTGVFSHAAAHMRNSVAFHAPLLGGRQRRRMVDLPYLLNPKMIRALTAML